MIETCQTTYGGRAYFATQFIPAHTVILSELPAVACVLDDFKKEVCHACFAYHHGATMPCQVGTSRACESCKHIKLDDKVQHMWDVVQKQKSRLKDVYLDLLRFCIAALPLYDDGRQDELGAFLALQDDYALSTDVERQSAQGVIDALNRLFPRPSETSKPHFTSSHAHSSLAHPSPARSNTRPEEIHGNDEQEHEIDYDQIVKSVSGRMKCNAFGIWQQLDDGSSFAESEMLGFALYLSSSFFNHACAPNVTKTRIGRQLQFTTNRDILQGEELTISYLGDREYRTVIERREALRGWGFDCICTLCRAELDCLEKIPIQENDLSDVK